MGRTTARILAASDVVSDIVIAGRNLETAERFATDLGAKATAVQVDAADEERLAFLAADSDIVVSTAGPSFKVALPAIRGAIKAGVHYTDLSEDASTTTKASALDAAAKAADITALMGMGETPGRSNLFMMHAAHQLDQAEAIRYFYFFPIIAAWGDPETVLAGWRDTGHADASWQQLMRGVAGKICLYRDGRWVDVDPVDDAVRVRPPQGGEVTAHPYGSSEPITLPRALPGVQSVSVLWSLLPPQLNELWCELGRRVARGELDESAAALSFYEHVTAQPDRWLAGSEGYPRGVAWAEAVGAKQGQRVRYKCWVSRDLTAPALATAALRILRGEIRARGVLAPESCLDPMSFLEEVAQYAPEKPAGGRLFDESFEVLE